MHADASEFLQHVNETPGASEFFARFQPKELFSPNSNIIKNILDKFVNLPPETLSKNCFYNVSLISKYLSLSMPVLISEDLFNTYLIILDKLPVSDLDDIVSLLVLRLSSSLKRIAVFSFPDCQSTFIYLGSCLMQDDLFDDAFQRLFCSFHLVPSSVTEHVYTSLRQSLKKGPARKRIPMIVNTACSYSHLAPGMLENVISSIVKTYPESLSHTTHENIFTATEQALRAVPIPQSVLKLMILTQHRSIIGFPANFQFLKTCPSLMFEYLSTLPERECSSSWYLILVKLSAMPVTTENSSVTISILLTLLSVCLKNSVFLEVIEPSQILTWFTNFVQTISYTREEIAVFATFLLILRTFDSVARAISDKELKSAIEEALKTRENRIPLTDGIVWVMDPTTSCPFRDQMDMFYRSPSLPPPCAGFVFRISPAILEPFFMTAISDSIPKGHPTVRTPVKARRRLERTHSKVRLQLNSSRETFLDPPVNEIVRDFKSEDSGSGIRLDDDDILICDEDTLEITRFLSEEDSTEDPVEEEEEDDFPREIESSRENLRPGFFLSLLLTSLLPLYKKTPHSELLSSLSTSDILLPLIPFSLVDEVAFEFLTSALGLSCPFTVFSAVYDRLSADMIKLSEFISRVAESTPLVTDYLYVTSPIPLPLNSSYLSLVIWIRPHCESTLFTLAFKSTTLLIVLSSTELRVPHAAAYLPIQKSINGWIMVTLSLSLNSLTLSANLNTLKVPHQSDGTLNHINIGDTSSHFDMQSVRAFTAVLSEDDIMSLFAAGPTHRETSSSTFIEAACPNRPFITPTGYVSEFYSKFISEFPSKANNSSLPLLSLSFAAPFRWIRLLTRGTQIQVPPVTVDRCRSHSFVNSLSCHGGLRLIFHLIGEASLGKPECARCLLQAISRMCSLYPGLPSLIEQKGGYRALGLLFRAGLVKSEDVAILSIDCTGNILNPAALEQTLFEAMSHHRSSTLLQVLIEQAKDKRGSEILNSINAFSKVADLLVKETGEDKQMGELLLCLNDPDHSIYNANALFEILMSALSFNEEKTPNQNGLSVLVQVFEKILETAVLMRPEIELLIPAIFSAGPKLVSSLSRLLIRFLSPQYLPLLSDILTSMPKEIQIGESLTDAVKKSPGVVRIAAAARCIACRGESDSFLHTLETIPGIWPEAVEIAISEYFKAIEAAGQSILNFPLLSAIIIKASLDAGKTNELSEFITRVSLIPDEPDLTLPFFLLRCSLPMGQTQFNLTGADIDRALIFSSPLASSLADKARFSPSTPPQTVIDYGDAALGAALSSETLKPISAAVTAIADISLMQIKDDIIKKWQTTITTSPKLSRLKRSADIGNFTPSRIPPLPSLNPMPVSPSLLSLVCRSIQKQSTILATAAPEPSTFKAETLWREVFSSLHYPSSNIFSFCPIKWTPSRSFPLLLPQNPAIDKTYSEFWSAKYTDSAPVIRLTLDAILSHFPKVSGEALFHSRATLVKGISTKDGLLTVETSGIRFTPGPIVSFTSLTSARSLSYLHKPSAVEIKGTVESLFFAFDSSQTRDSLLDILESRGIPVQRTVDSKSLGEQTRKWLDGVITNFDYLLYLNELSGRSFADFTQYPIFPWVLSDYTSDLSSFSLESPSVYRDLSLPIFAQTPEQQEACKQYHNTTQTLSGDPHHAPNYISNVGSAIYYLVRLEPFTGEEVRFQSGALDAADRTFQSLSITYSLMTAPGNRNALEAIPELYTLPEMFNNVNGINFPKSPITGRVVGDVELPPWSGDSRDLIRIMRQALEGPLATEKLSDWIDLVWGINRRNAGSLSRFNVFPRTVYEFDDSEAGGDRVLARALRDQVRNCGQAAAQLFKAPHPKKRIRDNREIQGKMIYVSERKGVIRATASEHSLSDELAVTCVETRGKIMVTGHAMPLIVVWRLDKGFVLEDISGTHQSRVTTVALSSRGLPVIIAGHEDGFITVLTEKPLRYVRSLETGFQEKVKVIKFIGLEGDFIVCQGRHVSLITVNGQIVGNAHTREEVTDAIGTNFLPGTKQNFVFVLSGEEVYCYDTSQFILRSVVRVRGKGTGIALSKGIVIVGHENDRVSCIKVE